MTGARPDGPGSRPSDGAQEVSTLTGFDPSRFEYRFSIDGENERHDWIVTGEHGAINIWAENRAGAGDYGRYWIGGIEGHAKKAADYQDAATPSQELCWLLLAPCWHDGSSLQFSELIELPQPTGKPMGDNVLDRLRPTLRDRYRLWLVREDEEQPA
jgi:hypothetical protein